MEHTNSLPLNDEESGNTSHKKTKGGFIWSKPKQMLVVLICAIIVLVIYLIIISSYIRNENKNKQENNQEPKPDTDPKTEPDPEPGQNADSLGKINCIYSLGSKEESGILNEDFEIPKAFDVYVDNIKINYTKEYRLKEKKEYNVTYIIYGDFNMANMFKDIQTLKEVEMNSETKCNITSMENAFQNCQNLAIFKIRGFDTSRVSSLKYMFYQSSVKSIELSDFNTQNVKDMSYMFSGCTSLSELDVSNFVTSSVTDMSYMFENCQNLKTIYVSTFKTSKVKNMKGMFMGCKILNSLDVSQFETGSVTDMSYMFSDCNLIQI